MVNLSFDHLYVKNSKALSDIYKNISSCTDTTDEKQTQIHSMFYLHSLNIQIIIPSCNLQSH